MAEDRKPPVFIPLPPGEHICAFCGYVTTTRVSEELGVHLCSESCDKQYKDWQRPDHPLKVAFEEEVRRIQRSIGLDPDKLK